MHDQIEMLDLVNPHDEVVGVMERNEVYAKGLSNLRSEGLSFRVVNAFIRNSNGEIFIPRRHPSKRLFPLRLDVSVGGHVSSGETYEEAFFKEASEELNLNMKEISYITLGRMSPFEDNTSAFMTVYEILSDSTPEYNPYDFIEHLWLAPERIIARLENGDVGKGDLPKIIRKFYL